jgi:CRP-like cAMP-binding protein
LQSASTTERHDGSAPHPIAELLSCPPAIASLLNASAETVAFDIGDALFHQNDFCQGLYVVVSGQLLRKSARLDTRITLGNVRAGEITELAAMLCDGRHTYTLIAQTPGTAMRLPKLALESAFVSYPSLRMRLLEELAREVSRAYRLSSAARLALIRHRANRISNAERQSSRSQTMHSEVQK